VPRHTHARRSTPAALAVGVKTRRKNPAQRVASLLRSYRLEGAPPLQLTQSSGAQRGVAGTATGRGRRACAALPAAVCRWGGGPAAVFAINRPSRARRAVGGASVPRRPMGGVIPPSQPTGRHARAPVPPGAPCGTKNEKAAPRRPPTQRFSPLDGAGGGGPTAGTRARRGPGRTAGDVEHERGVRERWWVPRGGARRRDGRQR